MKFEATTLAGALIIAPELLEDERGFFARTFCREEFAAHGLNPLVASNSTFLPPKVGHRTESGLVHRRTRRG